MDTMGGPDVTNYNTRQKLTSQLLDGEEVCITTYCIIMHMSFRGRGDLQHGN